MDCQDWQTVVVRGKAVKKTHATPPPKSAHSALMHKLDHDEPVKIKKLSNESRQAIIHARVGMSMNQTQLNTACSFPINSIRDIESGRVTPSPTQLNVLSRVLKLVLKYE
jgi:ribosome-binding protein aMBF1 (putative translation factor)